MRTVHADQLPRLDEKGIFVVDLVKLTTYTTRDSGTVDKTYYFASHEFTYNSQSWKPFVVEIGNLVTRIGHIQELGTQANNGMQRTLTITLRNDLVEATSGYYIPLSTDLQAHKLTTLEIEWSQLLLKDSTKDEWLYGPESMGGTEHTVFFRGELDNVTRITIDEIDLTFKAQIPPFPWKYALGHADIDPRDLGKALPLVFGQSTAFGVKGIGIRCGSSDHVYIVNSEQADAIGSVGAKSKTTGEVVAITSYVTTNVADTVTGISGTVATVTITQANITNILNDLNDPPLESGYGLEIYATLHGVEAQDADYKASIGVETEHFVDHLRYILEEVADMPRITFVQADLDTHYTETSSNLHTFVLNNLGDGFDTASMLAHMAYEARANLALDETSTGTVLRVLTLYPLPPDWPSADATITEWEALTENTKREESLKSRFVALYEYLPWRGNLGQPDAYNDSLECNETNNDLDPSPLSTAVLTAYQQYIGKRDLPTLFYRTIKDDATAIDILNTHARHSIYYFDSIYQLIGIPHTEGWRLQVGDLIEFIPRWTITPDDTDGDTIKARILETVKRPDGMMDVTCIRVRAT